MLRSVFAPIRIPYYILATVEVIYYSLAALFARECQGDRGDIWDMRGAARKNGRVRRDTGVGRRQTPLS